MRDSIAVTRFRSRRRGATTVEGALTLSVLVVMLFGLFDLGLAVCRYNVLSATARNVARTAIVRGAAASPELASWGPTGFAGTAADASEIATTTTGWLATMAPADVSLQVAWPDGDDKQHSRVSVQLGYDHRFLLSALGFGNLMHLQATSTMQIVH